MPLPLAQSRRPDHRSSDAGGMLWVVDMKTRNADGSPARVGNALGDHDFFGDEGVLSGKQPEFSVVTKSYAHARRPHTHAPLTSRSS